MHKHHLLSETQLKQENTLRMSQSQRKYVIMAINKHEMQ